VAYDEHLAEHIREVNARELAVHGWDVAQASGHPRPIPADLLAISALLLSDGNRYPLFGPPLRPPVAASLTPTPAPTRTDTPS